jgi:peptide/nickel transport system permease protein
MDINLNKDKINRASSSPRHPKINDYKNTMKLLLKNKLAAVGLVIVLIYFAIAILDTVYPEYLGVSNITSVFQFVHGAISSSIPPSPPVFNKGWEYFFGTTEYGVPLFPAILAALKFDMAVSVLIVLIGASIGTIIGTIAGYYGGKLDEVLMRITDIFFTVPFLVLALTIAAVLGPSLQNIILALVIIWWPIYARLARGQALSIKSNKYIEASIAMGSSRIRNVFVHVLPNLLSPAFVQISLDLGSIIQIFATLIFIGIHTGLHNLPELGYLLSIGQPYLPDGFWWPIIIPGIFLLIFTISINLLGDGLRDVLDPRLRR